jgi:hypothetical protein
MNLNNYVCTKLDAMETRRGIYWEAIITTPNGGQIFAEDRGDGGMVMFGTTPEFQQELENLQAHVAKQLDYPEGLGLAMSAVDVGESLQYGVEQVSGLL